MSEGKTTKQPEKLDAWVIDELTKLLSADFVPDGGVAEDIDSTRAYSHSNYAGSHVYHMYTWDDTSNNYIIEEVDHTQKYPQRITIETAERGPMLRTLLGWYLESAAQKRNNPMDDHPF